MVEKNLNYILAHNKLLSIFFTIFPFPPTLITLPVVVAKIRFNSMLTFHGWQRAPSKKYTFQHPVLINFTCMSLITSNVDDKRLYYDFWLCSLEYEVIGIILSWWPDDKREEFKICFNMHLFTAFPIFPMCSFENASHAKINLGSLVIRKVSRPRWILPKRTSSRPPSIRQPSPLYHSFGSYGIRVSFAL